MSPERDSGKLILEALKRAVCTYRMPDGTICGKPALPGTNPPRCMDHVGD